MIFLYYFTKLLSLPFYIVAVIFSSIGTLFEWTGGLVFNLTEYRVWLVLHHRACEKANRP